MGTACLTFLSLLLEFEDDMFSPSDSCLCTHMADMVLVLLQYDYGDMLKTSHQFYRSQWVGALPDGYDIPYRGNAFTTEVGPTKLNWGDITGGMMEGREAGGHQTQLLFC